MSTRLAYFVMAHHKPRHLKLLLDAIYDPRDLFLIHVDLKSMLGLKPERRGIWDAARQIAKGRPNIRVMRPRFTNWGGWSLSRLHLDAIDAALDWSPEWSHFVNLSGQCFPIKPIEKIRSSLMAAGQEQVHVQMLPFSGLPEDDWHLRWHPMLELPPKAIKLKGPRRPPDDFELEYKGSQWSILPRSFCEWQRSASVTQRVRRYLSGLMLSDELIIQTLVRNGPWRDAVAPHYGREIVMPGPKVMTLADVPSLLQSPGFFARKFDEAKDAEAIPALARHLGLDASSPALYPAAVGGRPSAMAET